MGIIRIPSHPPPSKMIEIYGYDTCPRTRLVRELLDSLELPYFYHSTPPFNNSDGVQKMQLRYQEFSGKNSSNLKTPLFIDQSKDLIATDIDKILNHLRKSYQKEKVLDVKWSDYSTEGASNQHGVIPGFKKSD